MMTYKQFQYLILVTKLYSDQIDVLILQFVISETLNVNRCRHHVAVCHLDHFSYVVLA